MKKAWYVSLYLDNIRRQTAVFFILPVWSGAAHRPIVSLAVVAELHVLLMQYSVKFQETAFKRSFPTFSH